MRIKFISDNSADLKWVVYAKGRASRMQGEGSHTLTPAKNIILRYGKDSNGTWVTLLRLHSAHMYYITLPSQVPVGGGSGYIEYTNVGTGAWSDDEGGFHPSTFTAVKYTLWEGSSASHQWTASVTDNGGGYSYAGEYDLPLDTSGVSGGGIFTGAGIVQRHVGTLSTFVASIYPYPTMNNGYSQCIALGIGHNPWVNIETSYIHPMLTPPTNSATQKMIGNYLCKILGTTYGNYIDIPGNFQTELQAFVDGAVVGKNLFDQYCMAVDADLHQQLTGNMSATMVEAIMSGHVNAGSARFTPHPELTVTYGGAHPYQTCEVTFKRDVVGVGEVTTTINGSYQYTEQQVVLAEGPPANAYQGGYRWTTYTRTYSNWYALQAHDRPGLMNGVSHVGTSPADSYSTVVENVMPEWTEWFNTHTPLEGPPQQTYDIRFAEGEVIEIFPIYKVDSFDGDIGLQREQGYGNLTFAIRHGFRHVYHKITGWTYLETRTYTRKDGSELLFPAFGTDLNLAEWFGSARAIVRSHKAVLNSVRTVYEAQETLLEDPTETTNALRALVLMLEDSNYISS